MLRRIDDSFLPENRIDRILVKIFKKVNIDYITIANLIFRLFPKNFIYSGKFWYVLNEYNIYEEDTNTCTIREFINDKITDILHNHHFELKSTQKIDDHQSIDEIYSKINRYLNSTFDKARIVKELSILYFDKKIQDKFNTSNPYLFAFKNGVYDIANKEFRLPKYDEFICCTSGYKYNAPDSKYIDELNKIIDDIFPDPIERKNALILLSTSLIGTNFLKIIIFLVGTGANGKSTVSQLLGLTLGNYFYLQDINDFDIRNNRINLYLALCKNSRWINFDVEHNKLNNWLEQLSNDWLRELLGETEIVARNLYQDSFKYFAKFKLCFQTNKKPFLNCKRSDINDHLRYITFRTKFVDNPSNTNERKIDRNLSQRILMDDGYKHAFFTILLEHLIELITAKKLII